MMKRIKDFFANSISIEQSAPETDIADRIRIATCALLIEMASADDEFDQDERNRIAAYFRTSFGLSEEKIKEIFELASQELDDRIDLWGLTNLINQHYSADQKIKTIETIWEVIYADGKLSAHEDYLVHKLYKMLNLTHRQLIEAKMKVLEKHKKAKDKSTD